MTVPSPSFLGFALLAALVFNISTRPWWRQTTLLVVNLLFLASFSRAPMAFLPMAAFLAYGLCVLRVTRNNSAPRLFVGLVMLTILFFFWLKRYAFIPNFTFISFPYLAIGLSYVFFRMLHVIIDNHQGAIDEEVSTLSFLNYTLNFTSLISGPIQLYQDYRRMETHCLPLNLAVAAEGLERIVLGYFKVAVVSMVLSFVQHDAMTALYNGQPLWSRLFDAALAAAVYPVYLYFNFSGYVDVVIGAARFFGIELPENFDRPFSSQNFIAFWSRWHMTLSNWLRTYVYSPLMLFCMRRIPAPNLAPYISIVAYFATFFLVGLWHGPTTEFLFFGLLQGGGVAANKLYQVIMEDRLTKKGYRALAANPLYRAFCRGLTFTWFAFTLLWFWSSWQEISGLYHSVGGMVAVFAWMAILAVSTVSLAALESMHGSVLELKWSGTPWVHSRYVRTAWATALSVITLSVAVLLDSPAPDIVYKAF